MIRTLSRLALPALAALALGVAAIVPHSPAADALLFGAIREIGPEDIVTTTYPVSGTFSDIRIDATAEDIRLRPSTDGTVSVVSQLPDVVTYSATVENGVLSLTRHAEQSYMYHSGASREVRVTVYLPAGDYGSLTFSSTTADIEVSPGLNFSAASLTTNTGDIELAGSVTGALVCKTSTGDVELNGPLAGSVEVDANTGEVDLQNLSTQSVLIKTTTGEIGLERVSVSGDVRIDTTSGDVDLEGTTAGGSIEIDTTSGDIELERSDAASLRLTASSGDIEASLLTAKNFQTSTSSGRARVSGYDPAAGLCEMRTTSGSITASVRP